MRLLLSCVVVLLLAACSTGPSPAPSSPSAPSASPGSTPTLNVPVGTIDPSTQGVVDSVIAHAAQLMDRDPVEFVVVRAEHGTFADSSLGCPFPNEGYDQVLTEGYWIVLLVGGSEVDYRVTRDGDMTICTIPSRSRQGPIG